MTKTKRMTDEEFAKLGYMDARAFQAEARRARESEAALLEALHDVATLFANGYSPKDAMQPGVSRELRARIRAAIARAEGRDG